MKILKILFLIVVSVSFFSCKKSNENQNSSKIDEENIVINEFSGPLKNCYLAVIGKDSIKLEIEITENDFEGYLNYKLFETDNSIGRYEGKISNDTLKGVYRLMSEGMISYADKYFLIEGNQLIEGVGENEFPNDSTVKFKHPDKLTFAESIKLDKIECTDNFIPEDIKKFYLEAH